MNNMILQESLKDTSGIYKITNLVNNKFYIGSSSCFYRRWDRHMYLLKNNKHSSIYLQRAFNKYGAQNFKFEVIKLCGKDELLQCEQWYLDELKPNYNVSDLARGGTVWWTEERRKAQSINRTGKKLNITQQERERRAENVKIAHKAKKVEISQYTKNGVFIKNWECLKEAADFLKINSNGISAVLKLKHNFAGGYRWTYKGEQLQPLIPSKRIYLKEQPKIRKPVIQYSLEGDYINEFDSLTIAQEQTGVHIASIVRQIQGKVKRAGKFKWKFKNKENDKSKEKDF